MAYFDELAKFGHEQIVFCNDTATGLKAVIAIHSTVLGPALGGCRMWSYKTEAEAVRDALRLSRGMTYKNAAAGLNIGGGKAVIIGDSRQDKTEALFRAFGQYVESLGGRYITAEDVGTAVEDMEAINLETEFVCGLSKEEGGSGDPSPFTAKGVFEGIKASVKHLYNRDELAGLKVAVQGLGHVGYYLCEMLNKADVQLIVTDIASEKVDKVVTDFGATAVTGEDIYAADADIFAPCALGAIVNDDTLPKMKFKIIAGAANNQLLDEKKFSRILQKQGILYAPDYIINAGGVISVYYEAIDEYLESKVKRKVDNIYNTVDEIYHICAKENITTVAAAEQIAERRMDLIGKIHQKYFPSGYGN